MSLIVLGVGNIDMGTVLKQVVKISNMTGSAMLSDLISDYDMWVLLLVGGLWDKSGRQCLVSIIALFYRVKKICRVKTFARRNAGYTDIQCISCYQLQHSHL